MFGSFAQLLAFSGLLSKMCWNHLRLTYPFAPPSENLLFTGGDGSHAQLWDISDIIPSKEDGSHSKTLSVAKQKFIGHTGNVLGLKFNPALNLLVTGSADANTRGIPFFLLP